LRDDYSNFCVRYADGRASGGVDLIANAVDAGPMPWTRKLSEPLILKDGRTLATLGEAREMMLSLPPIHRRGGCGAMLPSY
jgi:hypothetical protein